MQTQASPRPNVGAARAGAAGGATNMAPGYANDAVYGSDRARAKVEGGPRSGYYDEKEGKYREELPAAGMGERITAGITRPTNLTAGERPHMGTASTGHDDWEATSYESVASLPPDESGWWPHWASLPAMWYPWNVNAQAYRLGMIPVIAICILGTDKRHERWLWYVILALTVDYFLRMIAGPRASLCTLFGDFLDAIFSWCRTPGTPKGLFPRSIVAGAPYQFSDFMGVLVLTAATVCFFDGDEDDSDTAGAVLLAFQALIAFIELVFGFPVWVWLFNQMIHFGWIWKDNEIKSAMMRDEAQRAEVSEELRSNAALAQLRDSKHAQAPRTVNFAGKGNRSLPYSYRTANEYHKRHDWNPVKNIKTTHFLAPATLAALAWVWVLCSRDYIFGTPDLVWQILIIAAIVLFALEFALYCFKVMFYSRHVMWEWEHPIYRSMFLMIPLAWLLFIPSIVAAGYPTLAEVVFWMGAPLLLFLSLIQLAYHVHQNHFFDNFGGVWLIIPLANAVAAYMLTIVHRSYYEAAWLWLGISIFLWFIFSTLLWFKLAFHPRPHDAHRYFLWNMMGTAFAIAIAIAGIYNQTNAFNTVNPLSGQPFTLATQTGTTLINPGSYNIRADSVAEPKLFLPLLAAPDQGDVRVFSSEQDRAYTIFPTGTNVINGQNLGYVVEPRDGGARCTDNSAAGTTTGWTCTTIEGSTTSAWHDWGLMAFYTGIVLFLLMLLLALHSFFGRNRWSVSWWVVPLNMCLMSVAWLLYHAAWRSATTRGMATTSIVLTCIACALQFFNHVRALLWREALYRPDHLMLSPLEFFRLPNKALREVLYLLQAHINNPKATVDEWRHFDTVLLPRYSLTMSVMNYVKRGALYPVLGAWFGSQLYRPLDENSRALDDSLIRITDEMRQVQSMPVNHAERAAAEAKVRADFATYVSGVTANMEEEDAHVYTLARRYIGAKEANAMVRKSWDEVPPSRWAEVIPFVVNFLYTDRLRVRWLECFLHGAPEHAQLCGKFLYENLDPFVYERLTIDVPEMRPRMTKGYSRVW